MTSKVSLMYYVSTCTDRIIHSTPTLPYSVFCVIVHWLTKGRTDGLIYWLTDYWLIPGFGGFIDGATLDQNPNFIFFPCCNLIDKLSVLMKIFMNNKSYDFRHQHCATLLRFSNNDKQCYHIILCSSNIWYFIFSLVFFIIYGYITNSHSDQLGAGLIAQLVEHCTGMSQVMGSNPFQAWIFFRL